jgi:glycosyltransferase involved in cell wall biosynthesis
VADSLEHADVSVALCTYNGALFVAEQVASILAQRPAPREIVVGDDASSDATIAIIERTVAEARAAEPALSTELVVLRRESSLGITSNFEATIAQCRAEIVALSDQDDVWPLGRLARLLVAFDDPAVQLVHSDARLLDGRGAPLGASLLQVLEAGAAERAALAAGRAWPVLLRRNLVTGATVLLRRSLAERARPFPAAWVHDEWLAASAAAAGGLRLIDETLLDYRQHGGNVIGATRVTAAQRWRRLREPRAERAARLVARASALVIRLPEWGVSADIVADAHAKLRFEQARASAPRWQPARVPGIVARFARGEYGRFARGPIDVLRDLVQPPGTR